MNADNHPQAALGTTYLIEQIRNGEVIASETVHNLIPTEGLNHAVSVIVKQGTQAAGWYIGLFEGNYGPVPGDTAATFPTSAVECTAYSPSTRPPFTAGSVAGGAADNTASRAEFTFTAAKTLYGAFLVPSATKGGVTGPLLSAARFAEPKTVAVDDVLRVTATFQATSV